ncbi:MAG: hypothetical protein ACC662_03420, partial [Planctomycetota bacterium]
MTATDAAAAQTVARPKVPYVGLRPFERSEEDLFFGRERDASILSNKILSSRLTILYAQSGHGKSSLLRALVIPRIEAEDCVVLYFDAWTQEEPLRALKEALAAVAEELGVPDAGGGGPTLAELVRLIGAVDDRGVVLVLDQFEEFLTTHGRKLDPMRRELAGLARAGDLDVHVLLSLREEFLAALEPFRQAILDLFRSTYRLEGLSLEGLREAVQRPAEAFGGSCEDELVDTLRDDLRSEEAGERAGEESGASVELPMLQLVCSRLWQAAGDGRLTSALYERLGRADRILREYVRDVMPARWGDKKLTAQLMKALAPPSGLKMSYSVEDLAQATGLPRPRVQAELHRLDKARILRTREYRAGTRYELQHDAFIKVVAPWRDEVLRRVHRRRVVLGLVGTAAVVILVMGALWYLSYREGLKEETHRAAIDQEKRRIAEEKHKGELLASVNKKRLTWLAGGMLEELDDDEPEREAGLVASRLDFLASYY